MKELPNADDQLNVSKIDSEVIRNYDIFIRFIHVLYTFLQYHHRKYDFLIIFQPVLLNNTSKAKVEVLFFNRATKVGSLAILKLMDVYLKKNNGFNVRVDAQDRTLDGRLSKEEQVLICYQLDNVTLIPC